MSKTTWLWRIVLSIVLTGIVAPTYAEEFETRSIAVNEEYAAVLRASLSARAYQRRVVFTENGLFVLAEDSLYRIGRDETVERHLITDCYRLIEWHDKVLCVGINTLSIFDPRTHKTTAHDLPNLVSVDARDDAVVTVQRLHDHLIISFFNLTFEKEESFTTAVRAQRVKVIDRKKRQYLALQDLDIGYQQQRVFLCRDNDIVKDLTNGLSSPKLRGVTGGGTVIVTGYAGETPMIVAYDLTGMERGRRQSPGGGVPLDVLWLGELLLLFNDPVLAPGFTGLWLLSDELELVRDLSDYTQRGVYISASKKLMIAGKVEQLVGFETATGVQTWQRKYEAPAPDGTLIFSANVQLDGHDYLGQLWSTGDNHPVPSVVLVLRSYETGEVTQLKTLASTKCQFVSSEAAGIVVYAPDQPLHFITPVP